jgi:hypothetical protein
MTCRHYVGPLQHLWITRRFNPTFGGTDYYCSCGRSVRVDEEVPVCPDVALTWRYSTEEST